MTNQKLEDEGVMFCFEKVKDLIKSLPEDTFRGNTKLATQKEMADAALGLLEKFFNNLPKIKKDEASEFTSNVNNFKEMFALACGRHLTINQPVT
ncbi:MAG: hypothetical protein PVH61_29330 [Candidatus Aminicenantes bacterium]